MALRAGETGITRRLFNKLKRLPPIKTIGSGLSLDSSGVLKATISPTDVGLVSVKTATYTGDGTDACSFEISIASDETLLCILGIDDITTDSQYEPLYYNHINAFYPVSWAKTGYTGANALTAQESVFKAYSGRASATAFESSVIVQLSGVLSHPEELCNVDDHTYEVTYMTYKVTTPTSKKSKK